MIRSARSRSDIARIMGHMEGPETFAAPTSATASAAACSVLNVAQDARGPERNALYLAQGGLMLPDPTYYSAAQVADIRDKYSDVSSSRS